MSLPAAARGFVVFLLVVQVVQGLDDWGVTYSSTEICAVKGSTVEIRCSYTYPSRWKGSVNTVEKTFWFKQKGGQRLALTTDSEYAGRVENLCENNICTLRIRNLRESDSAEYMFRFETNQKGGRYFGSPGVTLSLTDLSVQVESNDSSRANLKCQSSCDLPDNDYVWYKNGEKIQTGTSPSLQVDLSFQDSYSCAVKGFENSPSPSVLVQGQGGWGVTYTSTEVCAVKGSTVEIRCSFTYPSPWRGRVNTVEKTFWFTKQKDGDPVDLFTESEYAGRLEDICENNICTLRIKNLRESDSADYRFWIETNQPDGKYSGSPAVTLSLTDLSVQVESNDSSSANLKCQSSCVVPDNDYVWYKNGEKIQTGTSSSLQVDLSFLDSYSCSVKGYENSPSPSVCVTGRDSNTLTYTEGSIGAPKGSSVDISCTYSSNDCITSKFWFSPERSHQGQNPSQPEDLSKDSQYAGRVQILETERGRSTLRISDLRDSDSAQYLFKFKTPSFEWRSDLPGTTLTVTALQVQVIRAKVYNYSTEAELKCHSSCSPAGSLNYVWFKNGEKITSMNTSSYEGLFQPRDTVSCALEGHQDFPSPPVYAPRIPSLSRPSGEINEGSSVTLTCSSDANPAANYTWYKRNSNADLPPLSEEAQLVFRSIQSSDSGQYFCTAENELGRKPSKDISIDVKYAPRIPSLSKPSGEIKEGRSVTLTCSSDANPAANYTWYKRNNNSGLPPLSEEPQLVFRSIQPSDSVQYNCTAENKLGRKTSKDISIDVKYAPKTSSVSASPSAEIEIGKSLQLTCKSGANPAANYTWYKDNQTLPGGSKDIYQLASITLEDKGNYHCESKNEYGQINSTSVRIDVQYAPKPPSVSVSPSAEIEEGSSVTLTCSSDANPAANYTWYKEDEDSPTASGQIFNITDFRAEHSGSYYCEAQNKLGRLNSTLHLSVVADTSPMIVNITRFSVVVLGLIPLLLWMRKKKTVSSTSEANEPIETVELESDPVYENVSDLNMVSAEQTEEPEEQEDLV
ncbi:B-cell receptor CD22-like isoform X1 [Trematomus bernacchii]|uniref:B-cell receptor CD22-like isoform X1 n=1 Tax=Trematomus bernacchii TaxID=40690 RepID=UPI00146A4BDE|nr:B-cell receptor CD22-like isoform X1 [Trematomus bernacchii]